MATVNRFDLLDEAPRKPKAQSKPKPKATPTNTRNQQDNRGGNGGHGGRRGGGRGGNKGGHGHQRPGRGREFDRHSGTGRGRDRSNKNSQFGWGGDGIDEYHKTGEAPAASTAEATPAVEGEAKAEEPVEPEDTSKTFEEFTAAKKAAYVATGRTIRSTRNADFEGRKAVAVKAKKDEGSSSKVVRKSSNKKNVLSLDQFAPAPQQQRERRDDRDRRDNRGGRGRGRGRQGGRGDRRQQRGGRVNISVNDNDFPTLG